MAVVPPPTPTSVPRRHPWQLGPVGRRWFDAVLTLGLLAPVPLFLIGGLGPAWFVLSLAQIAPLWWRRTHPDLVFAAIAAASAAQAVLVSEPLWGQLAFPIAVYSVARYSTAGRAAAALAVGLVASVVAAVDWLRGYDVGLTARSVTGYLLPCAAIVLTAWALGSLGRIRRAHVDALVERSERVEREAAQQAALAASEERARIAREMHDVVAHGLTTIVVQADGGRYAATHDPQVAAATLERIAATGREALTDMRGLLGLLRTGDSTGRSPLPALADLPALVSDAGAELDWQVPGDAEVPAAVGLTTFRVVQEALTNVRRHAGPDPRARVAVRVRPGTVELDVTDEGRGAATEDDGRGHGLTGMRERLDVHGGTLAAGPRPGGGFAVIARIPW